MLERFGVIDQYIEHCTIGHCSTVLVENAPFSARVIYANGMVVIGSTCAPMLRHHKFCIGFSVGVRVVNGGDVTACIVVVGGVYEYTSVCCGLYQYIEFCIGRHRSSVLLENRPFSVCVPYANGRIYIRSDIAIVMRHEKDFVRLSIGASVVNEGVIVRGIAGRCGMFEGAGLCICRKLKSTQQEEKADKMPSENGFYSVY